MNAAAKPRDPRKALLGMIHMSKKQLGLDDDTYRAVVARITKGKTSSADCTFTELKALADHFRAQGVAPKVVAGGQAGKPRAAGPRRADHPAAKKARALWLALADLGVIRERSESALEAFAARQLGVEKLQWANQGQTYKLIEALKKMAERAGWSQAGTLDDIKDRLAQLLEARGRG